MQEKSAPSQYGATWTGNSVENLSHLKVSDLNSLLFLLLYLLSVIRYWTTPTVFSLFD